MSLSALQRICAASVQEHGAEGVAEMTQVLAQLGNGGRCKNNILRDLQVALERDNALYVTPTYLTIPIAHGRTMQWPVVPPHELFGKLLQHNVGSRILRGTLDLSGFWNSMATEPGFARHPVVNDHSKRAQTFPIRIHGDDGRWSGKERPILVLQWGGMHHTPHPYDCRLLCCVIPGILYRKSRKINHTLRAIWTFLTWSFNLMLEGRWPAEPFPGTVLSALGASQAGNCFPGGMRAAVIGSKGDWKFEKETFEQTRSWQHNDVCCLCNASKATGTQLPFYDFSSGAGWRATVLSDEEACPLMSSPLLGLDGWARAMIWDDLLHAIFIGPAKSFAGSAITLLARQHHWNDGTVDDNLAMACLAFRSWCFRPKNDSVRLQ